MAFQAGLADAIILNGGTDARETLGHLPDLPILRATPQPYGDTSWVNGASVVAFAGIANPARFFSLLETLGAKVVARRAFADHQALTQAEATDLLRLARGKGAQLVTTEKDFVRLNGPQHGSINELRAMTRSLPIVTVFAAGDIAHLEQLISKAIAVKQR